MNKAISGTDMENQALEELVVASWNKGSPTPVFNNAAQVCVLSIRHMNVYKKHGSQRQQMLFNAGQLGRGLIEGYRMG